LNFSQLGYYVLARAITLLLVFLTVTFMIFMAIFIITEEIPYRQGDIMRKKKTFIVRTSTYTSHFPNVPFALIALYFFIPAFMRALSVPVDFFILAILPFISVLFCLMSYLKNTNTSQIHLKNVNVYVSSIVVFIFLINVYIGVLAFLLPFCHTLGVV
jgi:4-hydroxybenzoate polyprenyltransferase